MQIFKGKETHKKGFTLIELLVVIAIIGILASVVLASLNSARKKSRDARRIADVKQIQLALELFFDAASNNIYPTDIYAVSGGLAPTYIPQVPKDPLGQTNYAYTCGGGTTYHIGVGLEQNATQNPALASDRDASGTTICSGDTINGTLESDNSNASCASGTGRSCYDVTP